MRTRNVQVFADACAVCGARCSSDGPRDRHGSVYCSRSHRDESDADDERLAREEISTWSPGTLDAVAGSDTIRISRMLGRRPASSGVVSDLRNASLSFERGGLP